MVVSSVRYKKRIVYRVSKHMPLWVVCIYGSFKKHASLNFMHTGYHCQESIRLSHIWRALSGDVIERYEECHTLEAGVI